ncbi:hypothetical protein H6P81_020053 [Aristolochia fimbriata]|uniref:Uncharacterized protein n=1 Tax=Aristolochia fimbriata TaxID=158543 RepID=A0AAV7DUD5_ARIFI|nr:hypothetical protein H6P81_020053 [Aristolochia fimbriata]
MSDILKELDEAVEMEVQRKAEERKTFKCMKALAYNPGKNGEHGFLKCVLSKSGLGILSWNIQGVNLEPKAANVKDTIKKYVFVTVVSVFNLAPFANPLWVQLEAIGTTGGVIIVGDSNYMNIEEMEMGVFSVGVKIKDINSNQCWALVGIYGPSLYTERAVLGRN